MSSCLALGHLAAVELLHGFHCKAIQCQIQTDERSGMRDPVGQKWDQKWRFSHALRKCGQYVEIFGQSTGLSGLFVNFLLAVSMWKMSQKWG